MGNPLGKIVEVTPFDKEKEMGGFVIAVENEHMPEKGTVKSIGVGVTALKVGDDILFHKGAYSKVEIDGEPVLLMEEDKVFYIL
jgi:co-chaperonin GroES (HSP10)